MALSATEQTQLKSLITREGGLAAFKDEVQAIYIADRQAAALTALQGAISVTVTDWAALAAHVAQASSVTLYAVLEAIEAAAAARDASKLGPLFVQLYGAARKHLKP
jgi:hypothetical protein